MNSPLTSRTTKSTSHPFILLYPSWCRFRSIVSARGTTRNDRMRATILSASFLILAASVFRGAWWIVAEMSKSALLSSLLPDVIFDLFLLSMVTIGCISNLASSLGILFFADDLELILASPITATRFFIGRLGRVWLHCSWMPLIFCVPVIAALGLYSHAPPLFYLAALVLIPATLLIPTLIASLIAIPIALILPRFALKGTKILLGGCGAVLLFLGFLILPSLFNEATSTERVMRLFYYITLPDARFLPIRWVSAVLSGLSVGSHQPLGAYLVLFAALLTAGGSLSFLVYAIAYPRAYALTKTASNVSEATFSLVRIVERLAPRASPQSRAIITAEIASIIREWSSLFEIALLVVLGSAYLSNIRLFGAATSLAGPEEMRMTRILFALNFGLGSFFGLACASRLIFPSISRDGRSAWLLYTSPVTIEEIVRTKARLWSLVLGTLISTFLTLSTYLTTGSLQVSFVTALFGIVLAHGIAGIAVGFGGEYATFTWEHLSQLAGSLGSFLCMITGAAYTACCLGLVVGTLLVSPRLAGLLGSWSAILLPAIALGIMWLFSRSLSQYLLKRACRCLARDLK